MENFNCWYKHVCEYCPGQINCMTYIQMMNQFENSGLPKAKYRPIKLVPDDEDVESFLTLKDIKSNIVEFVTNGKNLFISSKVTGNGKTSWAIKLMQSYFHHVAVGNYGNQKALFVSVSDFLLRAKDFDNRMTRDYKDLLENVDLVVWDDIALTSMSEYDYSQLYTILDHRLRNEKSNIYTSNICYDELESTLGARLSSRILSNCEIIEFNGGDRR